MTRNNIRGHLSQGRFRKTGTKVKSDIRNSFPILARADSVVFCQTLPFPTLKKFCKFVFYLAMRIVGFYQNTLRKELNEHFVLLLIPEGFTSYALSYLRSFVILRDSSSSFQLVESSPLAN